MIGDTMDIFEQFRNDFTGKTVLVTGGAGFVGSIFRIDWFNWAQMFVS